MGELEDTIRAMRDVNALQVMAAFTVGEVLEEDEDASVEAIVKEARRRMARTFGEQAARLVSADVVDAAMRWECPSCWWRELQTRLDALVALTEVCANPQDERGTMRRLDKIQEELASVVRSLDRADPPEPLLPRHILSILLAVR